jgi:hypothetical protein
MNQPLFLHFFVLDFPFYRGPSAEVTLLLAQAFRLLLATRVLHGAWQSVSQGLLVLFGQEKEFKQDR